MPSCSPCAVRLGGGITRVGPPPTGPMGSHRIFVLNATRRQDNKLFFLGKLLPSLQPSTTEPSSFQCPNGASDKDQSLPDKRSFTQCS